MVLAKGDGGGKSGSAGRGSIFCFCFITFRKKWCGSPWSAGSGGDGRIETGQRGRREIASGILFKVTVTEDWTEMSREESNTQCLLKLFLRVPLRNGDARLNWRSAVY